MKKINFKKIFNSKNNLFSLFIILAIFLVGRIALADNTISAAIGNIVGEIIAVAIRAISSILIILVNVLMSVAAYSDFIHAPAVEKGWVVIRDLCNMFFVVILLVIAFATILGQEEYGAKKMLPKLIMAAVLINFSKLICGLMIDVANVVMLTFVNAFSAIGAGNMLDILGIADVTKIAVGADSAAVTFGTIVTAYIFGLIYVTIATVVVAAMLGMLVVRLVMIWILVVLSPLAFFLQAVPGKGQQYAGQWWTRWTSNLLVGPIIAFFLWLSFASLQGASPLTASNTSDDLEAQNSDMTDASGLGSKAGTPAALAKFVIAIGMLMGGMKIAQEVGGEAGGAMGKIFSKGKGLATAAGIGALAIGGKAAGRAALGATGKVINLASEKDSVTGKRKGNAMGNFALGWQADLQGNAKKQRKEAAGKFLKKIGIGEKGSETGQDLINTKGFQAITSTVKGATAGFVTGGLVGAGVGAVAGATGFMTRNKIKNNVKEYEGAEGNLNNSRAELDVANANKTKADNHINEAQGHEKTVADYDKDKQEFDALDAAGVGLIGSTAPLADKIRHKDLKDKLNNKNVVDNYNTSKQYLAEPKNEKNGLQAAALSANQDVANKQSAFNSSQAKFNSLDKAGYDAAKKMQKKTDFLDTFRNTKAAMEDNTKKKKAARDWVKIASKDQSLLKNIDKPSEIYSSAGLSETWKKRFEELNGGGGDSKIAVDNMVAEISDKQNPLNADIKEAIAKALAAFMGKDGKIDTSTLGRVKDAVTREGFAPESYAGKVSTQYKQLGAYVEDVKDGSGSLQYDTFAKNSTNKIADKDIMGASFAKINAKAAEKGIDYNLDAAAGVNQKVDGSQLNKLSQVMSLLIDDEIAALQSVGANVNSNKISQLNTAKSRLAAGDLSGISLKNTDVVYKGDNDSERRRNEYNTTQHENLHQHGATNEAIVSSSADALQEAKLVGRIPKTEDGGGKSYVEVLGKMIASMEQAKANPEAIKAAVASQIDKWSPGNAQRVVETESGKRDTVKDVVSDTGGFNAEKFEATVDKLVSSLDRETSTNGLPKTSTTMSIEDRNFFLHNFNGLKKTVSHGDEIITNKLKPLSVLAINKERASAGASDRSL